MMVTTTERCRVVGGCSEPTYARGRCYEHHMQGFRSGAHFPITSRTGGLNRGHLVSDEQYDAMLAEQGGVCAICRQPEPVPGRSLAVDHDHDRGAARGLLCGPCNQGLGLLRDDPVRIRAAVEYLARWGRA